MFNKQKIFLLLRLLTIYLAQNFPAYADDAKFREWSDDFRYKMESAGSSFGMRFSDLLFDSLNNKTFFTFQGETSSFSISSSRNVFDNHDVMQSYTVVDHLSMPINLYSYGLAVANTNIFFSLGIGGSFDFSNIRQVAKSKFATLDKLEDRVKDIATSDWYNTILADNPPYEEAPSDPENVGFHLSSLNMARYKNIWNRIAFPSRLPFKADWLSNLDDGEIITYGGEGFIEMGPSLGIFSHFIGASGGAISSSASYHYYVRGQYQIAVMKESKDFVRIKVTRKAEGGSKSNVGMRTNSISFYDGFLLLGRNVAGISAALIPFNFNGRESNSLVNEQGFRFDLRNPEARDAYELAVLGRLAKADELALRYSQSSISSPVQRLFEKDANEKVSQESRDISFFVYNQSRSAQTTDSDADVSLNSESPQKIYSSVAENRFESQVFFGTREKLVTRTTVEYSAKVFATIFEGWIEDSITSGERLNAYQSMVENILQRGSIFPAVPISTPDLREHPYTGDSSMDDFKKSKYSEFGNSSFYFRIDAGEKEIHRFIAASEEDRWKILETVFGIEDHSWETESDRAFASFKGAVGKVLSTLMVPIDVRARSLESFNIASKIHEQWVQLSNLESQPKELVFALGKMFSDTIYGPEMMQTFTVALKDSKMPFFLTAYNASFGRVNIHEGEYSAVGKSLEEYRRAANMENPELKQNVNLAIDNIKITYMADGKMDLQFHISTVPQFLYFRVDRINVAMNTTAELVVLNVGQVRVGENHILLDRSESENYRGRLARAFDRTAIYELYVGAGSNRRDWGPVTSTRVDYTMPPQPSSD